MTATFKQIMVKNSNWMKPWTWPLSSQIVLGMLLGLVLGPWLGKSAAPLGEIGKVFVSLIKGIAAPLLFFAILDAVIWTNIRARDGWRLFAIAGFNAVCALALGLALSNWFRPGDHLAVIQQSHSLSGATIELSKEKIQLTKFFMGNIPVNFLSPFVESQMIPIVLLALLLGFAYRRVKRDQIAVGEKHFESLANGLHTLLRMFETMIHWAVKITPFAVFGVVAKTIGEYGYEPLKGLAMYVGVGLVGLAIHILVVYQSWVKFYAKIPLREFWRAMREAVFYSIGTNSSLATLPLTLKALERLKISKGSASLGACIGTNLNNDGIVLYEAMAVLMIAQAYGVDLSLGQQLVAAFSCVIAAIGIAGIPEAGIISLSIVLNTVGLPAEALPLLLTVDWVLARARSITNVLSDAVTSIVIDQGVTREI